MPLNALFDQPLLAGPELVSLFPVIGGVPWRENPAVYGVGGMIAFLGALIFIAFRNDSAEVSRAKDIQSALREFGFTYQRDNEIPLLVVMRQFLIGYGEAGGKIRHRFEATLSEGRTLQLMDYAYPVRTSRRTAYPFMTVALLSNKSWQFPKFAANPDGFLNFVPIKLGTGDINFDSHPKFSKMFKLQAEDEAAVRALLTPAVLEALEQFPGLTVEGCGNHLLVYWRYKRLKPTKWPKLQEEAKKVAQAFAATE